MTEETLVTNMYIVFLCYFRSYFYIVLFSFVRDDNVLIRVWETFASLLLCCIMRNIELILVVSQSSGIPDGVDTLRTSSGIFEGVDEGFQSF